MEDKSAFHKSKDTFLTVFGVVSGIAGIAGLVGGGLLGGIRAGIIVAVITFCLVVIAVVLLDKLAADKLRAFLKQRLVGKFRGLWDSDNIAKELKRDFEHAQTVKIKVTRGSELFDEKNKGEIGTYLSDMRDKADKDKEIYCHLLLIAPCYKLKHVRDRHRTHKDILKAEDFMNTWSETLDAVDKIQSDRSEKRNAYFHLDVRFYSGRHSKWRFYIFESSVRQFRTVLFSDYDAEKRKHGREIPMYKVVEDDQNIGGFMKRYFDEIWASALDREGLKRLILERNCEKKFCEECDILQADPKECQLCPCPEGSCRYWKHCTEFANKFL